MLADDPYAFVGVSGHFPALINAVLRRSLRAFSRRFRRLRSSRSRSTRILLTPSLTRDYQPLDWPV
jgi:hypothetical protein